MPQPPFAPRPDTNPASPNAAPPNGGSNGAGPNGAGQRRTPAGRAVPTPTVPSPTAPDRAGADPAGASRTATVPANRELTVNKVLAGAGAAATSAVFGSFFGAAGTVAGAALGSVASTVATAIYQRSLDRTRDTLVSRIRVNGRNIEITRTDTSGPATAGTVGSRSHASDEPTVLLSPAELSPAAREARTVRLPVEPAIAPRPPHRRWSLWVGATVLVFVLALAGVTGLEWIKGSTLTAGESGTSVGRVLDPRPASAPTEEEETTSTPEPSDGCPAD